MIYQVTPVAKPRMTQADKWKQRDCVLRYRAFCDEVRARMGALDLIDTSITFGVPMPKSWSKKKKLAMCGQPHTQKPDLSNFLKSIEDALYSKRYTGRDDSVIHRYRGLSKVWSEEGWIEVTAEGA
jgi:Holliday junction resolvase RusA-like endonuclease